MAAMPADAGNVMTRARAIGFICPQLAARLTMPTPRTAPMRMCVEETGRPNKEAAITMPTVRSKSTVLSCNSVKNLPRRRQQPRQSVQLRSGHVVRAGTHRVGKLAPVVLAANGPHRGIAPTSVWPADRSHIFQQMLIGRGHLTCRFPVRAAYDVVGGGQTSGQREVGCEMVVA